MVALGATTLPERRYEAAVVATILVLVAVRLVCAALTPLSFDESLYWVWSKHIAGGYYSHPPVNPILIRLGTELFGNTEFGVRVFNVLLALPASWAIWRSAAILFNDEKVGATAALYFNLTLVMAAGSIIATPDNAVVAAAAFLLLTLVKLFETGRAAWWLAIGVAFGIGMLSKYTTIFFAVSILAWLVLVPQQRKWLLTPWPYIAGVLALVVFSPTLIWNAQHGWASVLYQFHRLVVDEWSLRYFGEFFVTQMGLATPPVFILGVMGLVAHAVGRGRAARRARSSQRDGLADRALFRLAYVPWACRRQLAGADLCGIRDRGGCCRGTDQMGRRLGEHRALVAAACGAGWSGYRRLPLSAGGVRHRSAWSGRSDRARSRRRMEGIGCPTGRGTPKTRRTDRADKKLRA